jgi:hypothetical protein
MSIDSNPTPALRELARQSYLEVLDATKHQDDKIGRLFSGVAFLIAGATASLGLAQGILSFHYSVGGRLVPLPAQLVSAFYISVLLAVLLLINSLGSPLRLPRRTTQADSSSHLFFLSIADRSYEEWRNLWQKDEDELTSELYYEYIREASNLAIRAKYKYERTNEAIQFLTLALVCFSLTTILLMIAAAKTKGTSSVVTNWSILPRFGFASMVALFVAIIAYTAVKHEEGYIPRSGPSVASTTPGLRRFLSNNLHAVPLACSAFVFSIVLPGESWTRLIGILGVIVSVTLLYSLFQPRLTPASFEQASAEGSNPTSTRNAPKAASPLLVGLVVSGVLAVAVLLFGPPVLQPYFGMAAGAVLALNRAISRVGTTLLGVPRRLGNVRQSA